jgi:hypothetical protein
MAGHPSCASWSELEPELTGDPDITLLAHGTFSGLDASRTPEYLRKTAEAVTEFEKPSRRSWNSTQRRRAQSRGDEQAREPE